MAKRLDVDESGPLGFLLYLRKSGPGDKSVADQERVGRRDIDSIGGTVLDVFHDNLSASQYRRVQERPGFTKATNRIRAGGVDALWTFANNRAHRDLDDYIPLRRLCRDTGTLWRYGGRTYDLSKSSDRRAVNADAMRAEEFSDDLADAINRGVALALEDGKPHGRLPRGYRIIRDELTGKPIDRVPVPEQAAVLQWAADQVLKGVKLQPLAVAFAPRWKAAGGRPFKDGIVDQRILRDMLINPTYAGLRTHKGEVRRQGTWSAIFDLDTHHRLVEELTRPERTLHRGTTPRHLCSYIAECGACGDGVGTRTPTARGKVYPTVYRCAQGHVSRNMDRVDSRVVEVLMRLLENPGIAARLADPGHVGSGSIDKDMATIAELREAINVYVKDAARTRMRAELVVVYVNELESQIREAEQRIAEITGAYTSDLLRDLAKSPRRTWKDYDLLQRREILRQTVRIVIKPAPRSGVGPGQQGPLNVDVFPAGALRRDGQAASSTTGKSWPSWYAEQAGDGDAD